METKYVKLLLVGLVATLVALPGAEARTLPGYAVCAVAYCVEDNDVGSGNVTDTRVCTASGVIIVNVGNNNTYNFCTQDTETPASGA